MSYILGITWLIVEESGGEMEGYYSVKIPVGLIWGLYGILSYVLSMLSILSAIS
jgi:hypothetical protein